MLSSTSGWLRWVRYRSLCRGLNKLNAGACGGACLPQLKALDTFCSTALIIGEWVSNLIPWMNVYLGLVYLHIGTVAAVDGPITIIRSLPRNLYRIDDGLD